ncbi:MAG: hypothetical protein E8D45_01015, partial [Nitrospira sp.]
MDGIEIEPVAEDVTADVALAASSRPLIRRAGAGDLAAAGELFKVRTRTDEATAGASPDFTSPGRMGWLALEATRTIGMTSVWERRLRVSGQEHRVAYWTGLFIDPAHRSSFLYPQLVLAMFAGLRQEGLGYLYASVRRQPIAEAHVKIGFKKLGDLPVLAKPLRPALLVAKHTGLVRAAGRPWLRALCGLPDGVVGMGVRLATSRANRRATEFPWS